MESLSPQVVSAAKLPILNPNEFDLWKIRIEHYFLMSNYSLWEVIINDDSPAPTRVIKDKYQLKFNIHKDAKTLMEAIEKRFGGNKETKKIHDRLQKLISQLELLGESLSQEDINLKFLRGLPTEWRTHTLIWRNKTDLEEHSLDDLFNSLKIYEAEVKSSSFASTFTQNIAFVSSSNTYSTNEPISVAASVSAVSAKIYVSALPNVDTLGNDVIYSFFASQSSSPQLDNDDLKEIDANYLEEMDLKWQMAMLTVRARRFLQRTRKNLRANGPTSIGFDMSKVECYNCHRKGHFARKCSYDWSFQAEEEPTNYDVMAFTSSSSSSDNEVVSCSKACTKGYATLQSHYDKLTDDYRKSQFDVISYKTGLESVEARLLVYQQNESVVEEDIKLLKLEVQLRDNALVVLRQNLEKEEQERDDLKLKLEKFQTSSKYLSELLASQTIDKTGLGYNTQVFTRSMFDCDDYFTSESDDSLSPSPIYDRYQLGDGYHAVPLPYTGTFMPPKPDLVFHNAPNDVETVHAAFYVELSPTKPENNLSHTHRPSTPIIEDWVSDSEDESETKIPQNVPSFVQPTEQVKSHRPSVQYVETSIPTANHKIAIPKPTSNGKRKNRKACFGYHQQTARMPLPNPQRHVVPTSVVPKSKLIPINAARPITAAVLKTQVTRPRPAKPIVTKPYSPPRRHINRRLSLKSSNFPLKVNAVKVPQVNAAKDGNPQHALKDKGVIDSGCSRHMIGNMSYLSEFEELNGGYVSFSGNPKGGKIYGKGKIRTGKLDFDDVYFVKELKFNLFSVSQMWDNKNSVHFTHTECLVLSHEFKLPDENQVLLRVPRENNMYNVDLKNIVPSRDLTCLFAKATLDESNLWHRRLGHINFKTMNKLVKGNKREFSVPRNPQQNGIAERKNKTLIEAARTMLAHSLIPIPFWAEAVNTAYYVQNRGLVTKSQNKTPYELLHGRTQSIDFMRPFGCPVTILNTLDSLDKFDGKVDEGFLVGYFVSSKAFRVFNSKTQIVQETLHINFLKNKPNIAGSGPTWLFDIDTLTKTMNYQPITAGNQSNPSAGVLEQFVAKKQGREMSNNMCFFLFGLLVLQLLKTLMEMLPLMKRSLSLKEGSPSLNINEDNAAGTLVPVVGQLSTDSTNTFSAAGPSNAAVKLEDITYSDDEDNVGAEADFTNLETSITKVWVLVDLPHGKRAIGTKWVFRNKKDERGIVVRNKARLVAQGHTQEEGIDYEEVFAPVARIETIRLLLAYASFMGFMVYQIDVKSDFLYGTIKEEVYVFQPPGFDDPDYPDKVYKVIKALYGLHQAPRAWYETLANYLFENSFQRGKTDQTLFIKWQKELTFFLGLQVKQKKDRIFISHDKYVAEILRKFGLTDRKSASTPIDTKKPLLKDPDGEDVDVHTYRSMIGSLMYLTSSRPDIMFAVCACARF
nr:retrovirus-related Pol polyprotein from transposon TNT 1-94 [Tanacetum cinerariifolium]